MMLISSTAALLAALAGCSEEPRIVDSRQEARPVLSVVANVLPGHAAGFTGTIEPRYQTSLGFRILGRVVSRNAGLGQAVKKGALLAELDPLALKLAVRAAEADVRTAEAHLANARASEERLMKLLERDVVSEGQFELAVETHETATAGLARAQAKLAKANEQLGYTRLHAEFDGVVTAVRSEVGQVVSPGQVIMTIARTDTPEAVVDVPEQVAAGLAVGDGFEIALQVDPSGAASGKIREIAPQADPMTRTRRVRIALDRAPANFRLGTIVTATPHEAAGPRMELPASGIVERDGVSMVWVIDPASSKVFLRSVEVAARNGPQVELAGGLEHGSRVVVAGVNSLTSGQVVKIFEGEL